MAKTSRSLALPYSPWLARLQPGLAQAKVYDGYYGIYRIAQDHFVGIDRYITDEGDDTVLISDYSTGVVRRLFPISDTEFVMGPGFEVREPAELKVRFTKGVKGTVTGIRLQPTGGAESFAERVPLTEQDVLIASGQVRLSGTLMIPGTKGPHPAIILLHGSGPLTRYSFGPYPVSPRWQSEVRISTESDRRNP